MENKKKKVIITIGIMVILLIVGTTIAYFIKKVAGNEQSLKVAKITINYNDDTPIVRNTNIEPIYEDEMDEYATIKEFTIGNPNSKPLYLSFRLTEVSMSEELKNGLLRWNLYEVNNGNNSLINSGDFDKIEDKTEISIYSDKKIESNSSKTYKLYIWLEENKEEQNILQGLSYASKIEVTGYTRQTNKNKANPPVLAEGLIPVIYDEVSEKWEVADTSSEWYNYEEQKWANAVTLSNSELRSAPTGTELEMADINSMWVWIPRYKYRIPSNINSSIMTNLPTIDVIFENGIETSGESLENCPIDSTTCYYTHPAFRNGNSVYKTEHYDQGGWDEELEGIWIGKFETSEEVSGTPKIIPNAISINNRNLAYNFRSSLVFAGGEITDNGTVSQVTFNGNSTYGLTSSTNTHMMKNTEWGAVAYLSQSKYGKNGNPNYDGENKKIYKNNSGSNYQNFYTGRSGGEILPTQVSLGSYSYDDYSCESVEGNICNGDKTKLAGTGASTTGTIYGIYDMVGGDYDIVLTMTKNLSGNDSYYDSGFKGIYFKNGADTKGISFPELKYYDKYSDFNLSINNVIKGDATRETSYWSTNYADSSNIYFFRRGGSGNDSGRCSIFSHTRIDASNLQLSKGTYRVVLIP